MANTLLLVGTSISRCNQQTHRTDEIISLPLGDHTDDDSLEDPADIDIFDGAVLVDAAFAEDAVDDNAAGNDASLNYLRQMGQAHHRFDVFKSFFDDFVGEIEWGGFNYEGDEGLLAEMADSAEEGRGNAKEDRTINLIGSD